MITSRLTRILTLASLTACSATAADRHWDGGTVNIATDGDASSGGTAGNWDTTLTNWDQGTGLAHVAWNNAGVDTAIFGGTAGIVTLNADVAVNQVVLNASGYAIGSSGETNTLTFAGNYSDAVPAIDGTGAGAANITFNAKLTGTLAGGLVITSSSNIATPASTNRVYLSNTANDFTGDVTVLAGNLHALSRLGNASNKIILKGGGLFTLDGGGANYQVNNAIVVDAASGLSMNTSGSSSLNLNGAISGTGNLAYRVAGSGTKMLNLKGDMSAYSGTFENVSGSASIQTTAASGGIWKLTGGTTTLAATNEDAISHGAGKSDLLMNGGTLDMNGKAETINGLSGATGIVQNQLGATAAALTLGDGNSTATFGGVIRDNAGTGGTLALTKTGTGIQTLSGANTYTGATLVSAGTLVLNGQLSQSPLTVQPGAKLILGGSLIDIAALSLESGSTFGAALDPSGSNTLLLADTLALDGTVTLVPTFAAAPAPGTYDYIVAGNGITGSATFVTDFSANGPTRVSGTAQVSGNAVQLNITTSGANLVWNNHDNTGVWNLDDDQNFLNGASHDEFLQYDHVTFGSSSPAGTVTLAGTLLPASVTVDSDSDFIFAGTGSLGGSASLAKTGGGTLTIENDNTASGDVSVSEGTLIVNGSLGTGELMANAGTTLGGDGVITGEAFIEGTVAPGNGIGTLATGSAIITGTYQCDIDGTTADTLAVTGDLDLTDATLLLNPINPPTGIKHVIATCTGTVSGNFASIPAGYIIDTSEPGKVVLWPEPVAPAAGTITFEVDQGYTAGATIATVHDSTTGAPFDGLQGWSRSTSGNPGSVLSTASNGEYFHGQAIHAPGGTYIGGKLGIVQVTGANTISFDAFGSTPLGVGFLGDPDHDGLFSQSETGLHCGIFSAGKFGYRFAGFGATIESAAATPANQWNRFHIAIGESIGGNRSITMSVYNLSTSTVVDLNGTDPGNDWTFSVTDAEFGVAPELAVGGFVRTSDATLDNIRLTSVAPPVGTTYDTWMSTFPTLTGNDRLADADPDHDGTANMLEFILNGNPTVSDSSILPQQSTSAGNLILSFNRRDDSESFAGLTLQYGTTLAAWTDVAIGAVDGSSGGVTWTVAENDAAPDHIVVTIPMGSDPAKFARLQAIANP